MLCFCYRSTEALEESGVSLFCTWLIKNLSLSKLAGLDTSYLGEDEGSASFERPLGCPKEILT